ncbi:hypothetical protein AB0F88_05055 [Streptosporangium sp. NPDC023963]|uniref:hypothetical protein n=1 Tax=Streptosporangium sp. NPDC023963 TaxID=3155608 RepID=UPI00344616E4
MNDFDLAHFAAAVHDRAPGWETADVQWQLTIGPTRDKSAAWVTCEDARRVIQLTVWTSGEAELDVGDLASGTTASVHYDLATSEDLAACLDDLTQHFAKQVRCTTRPIP